MNSFLWEQALTFYAHGHVVFTFHSYNIGTAAFGYVFFSGLQGILSLRERKRPQPHNTHITKTCLYDIDPLKPHFYTVKLGFTGVYVIFLISAQKHRLWYSLEPPHRGGSNEYPQSMFWAEIWKISEIFIRKFSVFGSEIFYIFE